jgi:hypothetical protein
MRCLNGFLGGTLKAIMDWSKRNCPNVAIVRHLLKLSVQKVVQIVDTNFSMVDRANLVVGIISMKL